MLKPTVNMDTAKRPREDLHGQQGLMDPTHAVQVSLNTCVTAGSVYSKEEEAGWLLGSYPSHDDPTLLKSIAISITVLLVRQKESQMYTPLLLLYTF